MVQKLKPNAQKILNDIKNKKIFLLDGATGTYLQNNGLEPGGCPEPVSYTHLTLPPICSV